MVGAAREPVRGRLGGLEEEVGEVGVNELVVLEGEMTEEVGDAGAEGVEGPQVALGLLGLLPGFKERPVGNVEAEPPLEPGGEEQDEELVLGVVEEPIVAVVNDDAVFH